MTNTDNVSLKGGKPGALGELNRMLILNILRINGNMSRADLCRQLSISFPAISSNVKSLIEAEYILEVGAGDNSMGRKSTLLSFNENRGYVIGVDLGRFWIRVKISDLLGNVLAGIKEATDVEHGGAATIQEIKRLLREVVRKSGKQKEKVFCICIGIPGVLKDERIVLAPFLPNISLSEIKAVIAADFAADVIIDNSINLGAIGEKWKGAGRKYQNFAFINYGVGVGGALVINGELYKGSNNAAGEIGFMVSEPAKLRQEFDEVGVLENVISRDKIKQYLSRQNFQEEVNLLIEKYKKEEAHSKAILDEIYLNLGMAFINLAAFLDLEAIIISGGLGISLGELFADKWNALLSKHVPFPPQIVLSDLDNQEGVLGAISIGIESLYQI